MIPNAATANGAAATTHPGRLASAMNLVGAMKADKPEIPDAEPTIATHETVAIASTGFFRDRPQDLFDLCSLGGKTVEIYWHLGRPGGSDVPCMSWSLVPNMPSSSRCAIGSGVSRGSSARDDDRPDILAAGRTRPSRRPTSTSRRPRTSASWSTESSRSDDVPARKPLTFERFRPLACASA